MCEAWVAQATPITSDFTPKNSARRANTSAIFRKPGTPLPANDVWIAAIARQHDLPILTRDDHFDAVAGLTRLSWIPPNELIRL
jgi:predicted nucleic acid-binding protein